MTQEEKQYIRDMYQQGMNPEDIANELCLDECKVMDYCAEILNEDLNMLVCPNCKRV